ncbi:hypothetical protein BG95_09070 [Thermosipho sp. 1063]|uniref:hypothetical protein n=1 Tax=unclassified Thermosipho (in: thermotogales) TaxID=2676525 RepID=UPI00094929AA|nr:MULTISPECIES: hypothetical protein [unclassified Thermosipho (in: thermotogales)]ANQ54704.1 hypothetical protein Y592_09175 [Thermosipho sp. 1070]APT73092.1 hypothetical protein BG95_09070 [Thermosipho sp. 1063]OOC42414.1 hypothetical protein XO08_09110 [Thermosipho sp. 1074]
MLKSTFNSKNSLFYIALNQLGIKNIINVRFEKNPINKKAIFFYDPDTLTIKDREFLSNKSYKIITIVVLDEHVGNIDNLLKNVPDNLIIVPILKNNLLKIKPYIFKSYIYKLLLFCTDSMPFLLKNLDLKRKILYVGIDLSHDTYNRKTHLAISAVTNFGNIIYLSRYRNLMLNEKLELEILEKEYVRLMDKYKEKTNSYPEIVFIIRDGVFLEDIKVVENILNMIEVKYVLAEVNKNSNINSCLNLKENIIRLEKNSFVYFPSSYNHQKGVEINIIRNCTDYSFEKIAEHIYGLTKITPPSPFSERRLPYPLYIVNKVALSDYEWKIYVPIGKDKIYNFIR